MSRTQLLESVVLTVSIVTPDSSPKKTRAYLLSITVYVDMRVQTTPGRIRHNKSLEAQQNIPRTEAGADHMSSKSAARFSALQGKCNKRVLPWYRRATYH